MGKKESGCKIGTKVNYLINTQLYYPLLGGYGRYCMTAV